MKRGAFTLLEVLLALAIAVLLLSAMYVAVNTHVRLAEAAREVTEHATLARMVFARMSGDILASLGPVAPDRSQSAAGTGTTAATATTGTTAPTTSGTTTAGSTTPTTGATTTTSLNGSVQFNLGVQGTADRLTLYVSRIPRDSRFLPEAMQTELEPVSSDLRRVTYWLAGGTDAPSGLARQVIRLVTSEDQMAAMPPDLADEGTYVIAEEVRSLSFSYFDGTSWLDTWDGTQPGSDGTTPMGPPLAIAILIELARGRVEGTNGENGTKRYRQVIPIPTANGATQQTTTGQ